jgi:hypothetical protein
MLHIDVHARVLKSVPAVVNKFFIEYHFWHHGVYIEPTHSQYVHSSVTPTKI